MISHACVATISFPLDFKVKKYAIKCALIQFAAEALWPNRSVFLLVYVYHIIFSFNGEEQDSWKG